MNCGVCTRAARALLSDFVSPFLCLGLVVLGSLYVYIQ